MNNVVFARQVQSCERITVLGLVNTSMLMNMNSSCFYNKVPIQFSPFKTTEHYWPWEGKDKKILSSLALRCHKNHFSTIAFNFYTKRRGFSSTNIITCIRARDSHLQRGNY